MTVTDLELASLPKIASGKVREIFEVDESTLLFVSTDRISAYDVVLRPGIPNKGAILTQLSAHWFSVLPGLVAAKAKARGDDSVSSGVPTHFLSLRVPDVVARSTADSPETKASLAQRSMQVRRLKVFPVEAIVRGYLAGSGWAEYRTSGTVHGLPVPAGLRECDQLPQPIYTPSTKAEAGGKDVNIHPREAAKIVGEKYAARIEALSLALYSAAAEYARERGIIIADTKFEFALDEATDEVVLADEVLTPDSSRFWPLADYEPGHDQPSFDKQFVRNWLVQHNLKGQDGVVLPVDVCQATEERYREVYRLLTGQTFEPLA